MYVSFFGFSTSQYRKSTNMGPTFNRTVIILFNTDKGYVTVITEITQHNSVDDLDQGYEYIQSWDVTLKEKEKL